MLNKTYSNRLNKILAHGPWKSPAELILSAFTLNSSVQVPPQKFAKLTEPEYYMVMAYGISKITKTNSTEWNNTIEDVDGAPVPPINVAPGKKLQFPKRNYNSIWNKPLLDTEDSLTKEDEAHSPENPYITSFPFNGTPVTNLPDIDISIEAANYYEKFRDASLSVQKELDSLNTKKISGLAGTDISIDETKQNTFLQPKPGKDFVTKKPSIKSKIKKLSIEYSCNNT